jgi:Phage integrase family
MPAGASQRGAPDVHSPPVAHELRSPPRMKIERHFQQSISMSYATHLLGDGYDIRTVQALLGYKDVSTAMVNTYVLNQDGRSVTSPTDRR